jgi:hypothetical protein
MSMDDGMRRRDKAKRTAFLKGWDACIMGLKRNSNPYNRRDYVRWWHWGYDWCARGDPLPACYSNEVAP